MVLENKLGIINATELARVEEKLVREKLWKCLKLAF